MVVAPSVRGLVAGVVAIVLGVGGGGCGDDDGTPPSCLPACAGSRAYDAEAYHLRARFDAEAGVLRGSEDITLADLDQAVVELDAEVDVTAVHAGSQQLAFSVDADADTLRVDLGPVIGDAAPVTFTVDYDAPLSDALVLGGPRDDDPVRSTVLFTDSEPDRGRRWLVAKHDPADRALWSAEVTVAVGDDVVSNGERVRDDVASGERTVGYRLPAPVPTYIMAFAAGQLEHTDRTSGRVPLAVWYRRGLVLDPAATLDAVADAMATFEDRVGPYPWASYAVVLLPSFGGGMENATITFNAETSSQGVVSFRLNAHELAHQWFGDHVTMRTYDDLWTKEGMATFLAVEAERARRDRQGVGRSFGSDFLFLTSSAVVDPDLRGLDKYDSGPYDRGAWVITQIRRVVGEDAFWAGLRKVLAEHALDSVDSEDFVRAFAPALDEAMIQRVLGSLYRHGGPQLTLTSTPVGAALDVTLALEDPEQVLIAPLELTVIDAAGAAGAYTVDIGAETTLTVPAGGYVAPDERGVHPSWPRNFDAAGMDYARMSERFAPPSTPANPALAAFLGRSPVPQERGIFGALAIPPAAEYRALYDGLDSNAAQEGLLTWTCNRFTGFSTGEATAIGAVIEPLLRAPTLARYNTGFMRCPVDLATRALGAELGALAAAPTGANAARLDYLLGFDYGTATNFTRLTRLVTTAPSLRMRERALTRMVAETSSGAPRRIPAADVPAWQAFFRERYGVVTSQFRLMLTWGGSINLADLQALPIVAPMLHRIPMSDGAQWQVVCDAHRMTRTVPDAWARFQDDAQPWAELGPSAASALADRTVCDQPRTRPLAPVTLADDVDERARLRPRP